MQDLFFDIGKPEGFKLRCMIFLPLIVSLLWVTIITYQSYREEFDRLQMLTPSEMATLRAFETIPPSEISEAANRLASKPEITGLVISESSKNEFHFKFEKKFDPHWHRPILIGPYTVVVALQRHQDSKIWAKSNLKWAASSILAIFLFAATFGFMRDLDGNYDFRFAARDMGSEEDNIKPMRLPSVGTEGVRPEATSKPYSEPLQADGKPELKVVNGGLKHEHRFGRAAVTLQIIEGGKGDNAND